MRWAALSGTSGVTAAFEAGLAGAPDCMVYTIGARVSADAGSTAAALANTDAATIR